MMTANKVDLMVRAVMLVKFQAGLDSSTLADRFNFYAYQQIAKWCGADDYNMWETDKCPIPVHLVRVKTGIKYTTFIDCDALDASQDLPVVEGGTPRPARSCRPDVPYHAKRADTRGMDLRRV